MNWRKGLDRILIIFGAGWYLFLLGIIAFNLFTGKGVDWSVAAPFFLGPIAILFAIRFLSRTLAWAVRGFKESPKGSDKQ